MEPTLAAVNVTAELASTTERFAIGEPAMASTRTRIIFTVLWVLSFAIWVPLISHAWALAITAVLYAVTLSSYWRLPSKDRNEADTSP